MYRNRMQSFFWKNKFKQQCVLFHYLFNKGELYYHCSFIDLNDAEFNSQFLSNAKCLFSETLLLKNHSQVRFTKEVISIQS